VRRLLSLVLAVPAALVALASPAAADPASPTHYRSEVTGIEGAGDGVEAWVHGGDSYLVLRAREGVEVVVLGYQEPERYIRIAPDGLVYVNTAGPSYYQNQDRYSEVIVPSDATPEAEPEWEAVDDGGAYAWHDHRIHWMSPSPPRHVGDSGAEEVFDWKVPILVDDEPATIMGALTWLPSPSPLLPLALAVGIVAILLVAGLRGPLTVPALGTVLAAAALGVVASGTADTAPLDGAASGDISLVPLLIPVAAGLGAALPRLPSIQRALLLAVAGLGLLLAVWGHSDVVTNPILPGWLSPPVARLLVAAAGGAALAAVVTAVIALLSPSPPAAGDAHEHTGAEAVPS
jgi:hypothetical protein